MCAAQNATMPESGTATTFPAFSVMEKILPFTKTLLFFSGGLIVTNINPTYVLWGLPPVSTVYVPVSDLLPPTLAVPDIQLQHFPPYPSLPSLSRSKQQLTPHLTSTYSPSPRLTLPPLPPSGLCSSILPYRVFQWLSHLQPSRELT